jgi:hypothetical protein
VWAGALLAVVLGLLLASRALGPAGSAIDVDDSDLTREIFAACHVNR